MTVDLDVHLGAIAAGDAAAFGRWLSGGEPVLRASLRSFAALVDTESVLQEALLRTWQVAPRLRPDGKANALLRLALRIARNHAIDTARRARRDLPADPTDLGELASVDPIEPDPLLRELLRQCREKLPAAPARALAARLSGEVRHDRELAALAEMSLNTFLKNVGRARQLLLDCLARRGVDLEQP